MLLPERLDDKNFLLYAAHHYSSPGCASTEEFYEDLKRIKYLKKALTRFQMTGEIRERLVLNHFIVLRNVFGPSALVRILFLKMRDQLSQVVPFLVLLNVLPARVLNIGRTGESWYTDAIPLDKGIVERLRTI